MFGLKIQMDCCNFEICFSPIAATYNVCENSGGFKSETYYYKRGANQHFNQPSHVIHPGGFKDSNLAFHDNDDSNAIIPIGNIYFDFSGIAF